MSEALSVLLIDDDDDLRELLRFHFERKGYDVRALADGREALEFLRTDNVRPDVIVLDLLMPDIDGREFLRHRRETPELERIPVIVLTGLEDEDILEEVFELGADDYVTKPFSPKALLTRVAHVE